MIDAVRLTFAALTQVPVPKHNELRVRTVDGVTERIQLGLDGDGRQHLAGRIARRTAHAEWCGGDHHGPPGSADRFRPQALSRRDVRASRTDRGVRSLRRSDHRANTPRGPRPRPRRGGGTRSLAQFLHGDRRTALSGDGDGRYRRTAAHARRGDAGCHGRHRNLGRAARRAPRLPPRRHSSRGQDNALAHIPCHLHPRRGPAARARRRNASPPLRSARGGCGTRNLDPGARRRADLSMASRGWSCSRSSATPG